jgi:hypothetical protein
MNSAAPWAYPQDLAATLRRAWPSWALPLPDSLEHILATAYHASFLRDEERPVTFRLLVAPPSSIVDDVSPPMGLLPMRFTEARPLDEHELRRMSPAAKYHRALIGVSEREGVPLAWGIVQSGPRWLQGAHGGRMREPALPPALVLRVVRPGHVVAACGADLVTELRGGRVSDLTLDVFASSWLPALFAAEREEIATAYRERGGDVIAENMQGATRSAGQQMVKRVLSIIRAAHHGGTVIFLPSSGEGVQHLSIKYAFQAQQPLSQFRRLMLAILSAQNTGDHTDLDALAELEEALFELGQLIAQLADVDGAVVLNKRFELLGFGAEISSALPGLQDVRRALDLEGERFVMERVDGVGTRHRSAYRMCAATPGALAIVVSQDGSVRFVTSHRGALTYWDHGVGDE